MSASPELDDIANEALSLITAGGALAVLILAVLSAVVHVFFGVPT